MQSSMQSEYKKNDFNILFLNLVLFSLIAVHSNSVPACHCFTEKSFVTSSSVSVSVWYIVSVRAGIRLQYAWRWAHAIVLLLFSPWSLDNYPRFYRFTLLNRASLIFIECQLVLHFDEDLGIWYLRDWLSAELLTCVIQCRVLTVIDICYLDFHLS